jgi:predicted Zn-ribbon and HTH transcriptional regulator
MGTHWQVCSSPGNRARDDHSTLLQAPTCPECRSTGIDAPRFILEPVTGA